MYSKLVHSRQWKEIQIEQSPQFGFYGTEILTSWDKGKNRNQERGIRQTATHFDRANYWYPSTRGLICLVANVKIRTEEYVHVYVTCVCYYIKLRNETETKASHNHHLTSVHCVDLPFHLSVPLMRHWMLQTVPCIMQIVSFVLASFGSTLLSLPGNCSGEGSRALKQARVSIPKSISTFLWEF